MTSLYDPTSPLARELSGNERLLWQGRPAQGLRLSPGDIFMIPFSLLWGGFAFFWEYSVLTSLGFDVSNPLGGMPQFNFFALWGIPFCLVGLYIIVGRFFFDAFSRGRTRYGVSDQRILIVRGGRTTALDLRNLPVIEISESRSGKGTLTFGPSSLLNVPGLWRGRYQAPPSPAFTGIDDVRKVYRIIQDAQAALGERR